MLNLVEAVTTSKYANKTEVVFHFTGDYDERYDAGEHQESLVYVVKSLLRASGNEYKVYKVPDKKLRKYHTTKKEASKLKFCRPDPKWLVNDDHDATRTGFDQVASLHRPTMNIKRDFEIKRNGGEPPEEEIKDASLNADPDAAFFSTTQGGSSLSEDKKAEIEALKK